MRYKPLPCCIVWMVRIERGPYLRAFFADGRHKRRPARLGDFLSFFDPTNINAFHGLNLWSVMSQALKDKLGAVNASNAVAQHRIERAKPHCHDLITQQLVH